MRKPLLSRRLVTLLAAYVVCLFGLPMSVPMSGHTSAQGTPGGVRQVPMFRDWSMRHVIYPRFGSMMAMQAAAQDPRAAFGWRRFGGLGRGGSLESDGSEPGGWGQQRLARTGMHRDWSINLGTAGTAPGMYPAKFSFDVTAAPSCAKDFVIFPVNAKGTGTQPNIVAFNNLYSGTAGGNGVCNRTPSGSDNGTAATVLWSYNVQGIAGDGAVTTSPALALDGTKVAFVESAPGQQPHFHVLAGKSGDGVDGSNLQNTLSPKVLNVFSSFAPASGSGSATDFMFGASGLGSGDTLSSPFVVYGIDQAYVGDDQGNLIRIRDVFCVVNPACAGGSPPPPSVDPTWGVGGTAVVGSGSCAGTANSKLTAPVVDFQTGNVFVGCADGKLYGFNSSGITLPNSPVAVGDGTATGGIVDPPMVDGVNGFVYVVSGSNGANAVLVQTRTDLSSPRTATLGKPGGQNIHAGAFNEAYFSSSNSASWLIYVQGYNGGGMQTFLYAAAFDAGRNLNTGAPALSLTLHITAIECSPLTEFLNGSTTTDGLFLSLLATGRLDAFDINTFPASTSATATETGGTSGIIVENGSTQSQASSIYFSTLGSNTAVKLTQAGLQ